MKVLTVGIDSMCDICLAHLSDSGISRFHLDITLSKNGRVYLLTDRASTNGTFSRDDLGQWERISQQIVSESTSIKLAKYETTLGALMASSSIKYDNKSNTVVSKKVFLGEAIAQGKVPYRNPETGEIMM
ncbi:MAG: FHA domain-containing protein [Opitutales bacterium]